MINIGSTVGNYRIIAKLGSGAMGSVFLAEHPKIGKRVALKVIHEELAGNAEMVSRFFTEARAVNQIGHPNIIDIQNFGQTPEGDNFIVMEYLEGKSLSHRLKTEKILALDLALHIAAQVADGLAASHQRGIVHRDLKPDNVFLISRNNDPTFVKILDFGLAKLIQADANLQHKTRAGSVLGTPHYMAPEQCEGRPDIDHRVDVYSLGCIMYEMLCGRVPFPGEGFGEVLVKHLREPPQMPSRINPQIPKSVENIILHALAKRREFRFQDMAEFRAALRAPERYNQALEGEAPFGAGTIAELRAPSSAAVAAARSAPMSRPSSFPMGAPMPVGPTVSDDEDHATYQVDSVTPGGTPQLIDETTPVEPALSSISHISSMGTSPRLLFILGGAALLLVALSSLITYAFLRKSGGAVRSVVVMSEPAGATVVRNGIEIGRTPLPISVVVGDPPQPLILRKPNYHDARPKVSADDAPSVLVKLLAAEDDLTPRAIKIETPKISVVPLKSLRVAPEPVPVAARPEPEGGRLPPPEPAARSTKPATSHRPARAERRRAPKVREEEEGLGLIPDREEPPPRRQKESAGPKKASGGDDVLAPSF